MKNLNIEEVVEEGNRAVKVYGVRDFNLDHIFDCGQCFRWEKNEDGSYTGMAYGNPVTMSYRDEILTIKNTSASDFANIWRKYLDLDRDYGSIKKFLAKDDAVMKSAIEFGQGIRILNQEKWETLLSFIISQNNNISRIKKCIDSLAETLGEYVGEYAGRKWYNLPAPDILAGATEEDLAPCRLGYRWKYLVETGRIVNEAGIESLSRLGSPFMTADETTEALRVYAGVGPKVANCIALFSMGHIESFPIDVWVKRVMNRLYGIEESNTREMAEYARDHFGEYSGIGQQYLFYYITHNKELSEMG